MFWTFLGGEKTANTVLVDTVEDASSEGNFPLCHTNTLVHEALSTASRGAGARQ